jgi:hypothetical protein
VAFQEFENLIHCLMEIQKTDILPGRIGFTLISLVAIIAIMTILAGLLFPALARARKRSQEIVCLTNSKQLTLAAHLYAAQNFDRWIGNGSSDVTVKFLQPPENYRPRVWAEGREGSGQFYLEEERTAEAMLSEKFSLIAPYLKTTATLKCPGDSQPTIRAANVNFVRNRNYAMNCFFGWTDPPWASEPNSSVKRFLIVGETTKPADFFLFGEIHPFSMCRPHFGVHPNNALKADPIACDYYHLPASFHGKVSVFSYADGHAAPHAWNSPFFNNPNRQWNDGFWHSHTGTQYPALSQERGRITADSIWLGRAATELKDQ